MKLRKITLSCCLAALLFAICLFVLPTKAKAETQGKYTYSVYNGNATITDCDTSISGKVTIPATLGNYPVTTIGTYAFSSCTKLTEVIIPSSVTSIGLDAFYGCEKLVSVTIPGSVTSIGDYAFERCYQLNKVSIGTGVTTIGTRAFGNCAVTSIDLPNSITSIGQQAFQYTNLADIFYNGTDAQWAKVKINSDNTYFNKAKVHCATTIAATHYPESDHNYPNKANESKTFTWPRAKKLVVTFSESTVVENNCDYIYLYDASGTQIAKYTGYAAAGITVEIPGDTFTIKLTSDGSVQKYGYAFSSIAAYIPKHNNHPYCGIICTCSTRHSSGTWTAWDGKTKLYSGNYYLTQDVVLDSTVILDYNYVTYLCLNGYSITCENTAFDIYSYRSLIITDCIGSGKIETTGSKSTIRNNKYLGVYGGTILNSNDAGCYAVEAYSGTSTYVRGGNITSVNDQAIIAWSGSAVYIEKGKVESTNRSAIYLDVGSNVYIRGGTVYGKYGGTEAVGGSGTPSQLTISGGQVTTDYSYIPAVDVASGNFTMSGGYIAGIYATNEGATTITGGTIDGVSYLESNSLTINAGAFRGDCDIGATSTTITGGNFAGCDELTVCGKTWICGGSFNKIQVENQTLYLSGVPDIAQLEVKYTGKISAQSIDGSGSFGGEAVEVILNEAATSWKDGDVVIKNVKSNAVAERFVLADADVWRFLNCSNNNLVLRILPHGTWGDNITWGIVDETLTLSGTGAVQYTHSGNLYPWGNYHSQIKAIVVEPGITEIPPYTFEYCEYAATISLPETLKTLALNAFNDCGSLNNLLLPSSLTAIEGTSNTGWPAFIRCESLTDVYYLGTKEEWTAIPNASYVDSANSTMVMHYLQQYASDATCAQAGTEPHYRFDDTSVYTFLYDTNRKPISQPVTIPPLGHSFTNYVSDENATCLEDGTETAKCDRCEMSDTQTEVNSALGHSFTSYKSDNNATCLEDGTKTAKCDRGDVTDTVTNADSKLGHSFTDYVSNKDATYDVDGTKTAKCDRCEEIDTVTDEGSKLIRNGWFSIEGKWYYYKNGVKTTGWQSVSGKWYYMNVSGVMQTGWLKLGSIWYYLDSSGAMVTGWKNIGGTYYFFNTSGAMQTGWLQLGGVWYYLKPSGAMATGWMQSGGKWYYFNASGTMKTGWLKQGGIWYYMDASGAMLSNTSRNIGGKIYYFDTSGKCKNP